MISATTTHQTGDNAALRAVATQPGGALCTIVEIDGSFSRRLGAQLAVLPDGRVVGSMADGCLEATLSREADAARQAGAARTLTFGGAEGPIDLRLPCGSRIAVCVDPFPDREAVAAALAALDRREPARLIVPANGFVREYRPELRVVALGTGPELDALLDLAAAYGATIAAARPLGEAGGTLSMGMAPDLAIDAWSAIVVLFHEHEWERAILPWALRSPAFYVGAQGGAEVRKTRAAYLAEAGLSDVMRDRLRSPVGLIERARDPGVLALSILAEIVAGFEAR